MSKTTPEEAKALAGKYGVFIESEAHDWEGLCSFKTAELAALIDEVHGVDAECTRSHPHENMDQLCELRTVIARLENEKANATPPNAPKGNEVIDAERQLRRMLGEQWCASQMVMMPYTDDGQFHDGSAHPGIDFMNAPVDEIRRKIQTRILSAIPQSRKPRAAQKG